MNDTSTRPTGSTFPPPRPWRLLRTREHRFAGVCNGLARASGVDVTWVRLAFVAAGFGGFGILIYLVLALVVPKEDPAAGELAVPAPAETARWIRIAIVGAAVVSLIQALDNRWWWFGGRDGLGLAVGLLLLATGAAIFLARRGGRAAHDPGTPPAPQHPYAAPAPGWSSSFPAPAGPSSAAAWPSPTPTTSVPTTTATPAATPADSPTTEYPVADPSVSDAGTGWRPMTSPMLGIPPMPPDRPRRKGAGLARVMGWLLALLALPVIFAVGAAVNVGALSLRWSGFFAVLAAAALIHLMVWSSLARRGMPIVLAATGLLAVGGVVALASHWDGGIGERIEQPATRADVAPRYHQAIGHQAIDLSKLSISGDPVTVAVDQRIGYAEIVVPDSPAVHVVASARAGSLVVFGTERSGFQVDNNRTDGTSETSRFELDVSVGYGRAVVCRAAAAHLVGGALRCPGTPG